MCCTRRMMKRLANACHQGSTLALAASIILAKTGSQIFCGNPRSISNAVTSFYGLYYNLYHPQNNNHVVNNNNNHPPVVDCRMLGG